MSAAVVDAHADAFAVSRARFATVVDWLDGPEAGALAHAELEDHLDAAGRELLRQLLQDHLELRAQRERRVPVVDSHGLPHAAVEAGHQRGLGTVLGTVRVTRLAYRRRGHPNLHPADAALNLPQGKHSHGLRRVAATEAARGSFDDTVAAIERATGQRVGKRQVEQLTVHVLEYLWRAAWSFYDEGDPAAQTWVRDKALAVLRGHARTVAAAIRRKLTVRRIDGARAVNAHRAADYLRNKQPYLGYAITLAMGWPIATGVIEGACRHLINDRLDITGARWGLDGSEAVLRLRALRSNNDLDDYWHYHLDREQQRVHLHRYTRNALPTAA